MLDIDPFSVFRWRPRSIIINRTIQPPKQCPSSSTRAPVVSTTAAVADIAEGEDAAIEAATEGEQVLNDCLIFDLSQ